MSVHGFKNAKAMLVKALETGDFQHDTTRDSVETKNLLLMGEISASDLCAVVQKCQGRNHQSSPHHSVKSVQVHILKRDGWYIKFYALGPKVPENPTVVFISVHKST